MVGVCGRFGVSLPYVILSERQLTKNPTRDVNQHRRVADRDNPALPSGRPDSDVRSFAVKAAQDDIVPNFGRS